MTDAWFDYVPVNEETLSGDVGSYPKPLGPILMRFPPDHPYSQAYTSVHDFMGGVCDFPGGMDQHWDRKRHNDK